MEMRLEAPSREPPSSNEVIVSARQVVRKRRYAVAGGALDLFPGQDQFAVFEMEFESESEAQAYSPPGFVREEVTNDPAYSGAARGQAPA